jgi:hypothetical protein
VYGLGSGVEGLIVEGLGSSGLCTSRRIVHVPLHFRVSILGVLGSGFQEHQLRVELVQMKSEGGGGTSPSLLQRCTQIST